MIEYLGSPGHFVAWHRCGFRLHTHVGGRYCVSTIGEMAERKLPFGGWDSQPPWEAVGMNRLYETMVFRISKDHHDGSNIDFAGYTDHYAAEFGHRAMVQKYFDSINDSGRLMLRDRVITAKSLRKDHPGWQWTAERSGMGHRYVGHQDGRTVVIRAAAMLVDEDMSETAWFADEGFRSMDYATWSLLETSNKLKEI
jgi:hypothetical protein